MPTSTQPQDLSRACKTGMKKKHPGAVALGKLSAASLTPEQRRAKASAAGKARAKKLSAEQRRAIGRMAAAARWKKEQ